MWEQYIVISLYRDKVLGRYVQTGKGFRMLCIHIKWELFIMYIITFFFVQVYIFTKSIVESCNLGNESFHHKVYTHTCMMPTAVF